jgi:transcription termination factor Rho
VNDRPTQRAWEEIPFGAMEVPPGYAPPGRKPTADAPSESRGPAPAEPREAHAPATAPPPGEGEPRDWRRPENRRGRGRRGGRRRRPHEGADQNGAIAPSESEAGEPAEAEEHPGQRGFAFSSDERHEAGVARAPEGGGGQGAWSGSDAGPGGGRRRRRRGRRGRGAPGFAPQAGGGAPRPASGGDGSTATAERTPERGPRGPRPAPERAVEVHSGMLVLEKGGWGVLRREEAQFLSSKDDVWVPQHLVARLKLREGSIVSGPCSRGQQHRYQLNQVDTVDGKDPREVAGLVPFKKLVSIDPDFHYAVGDVQGDVSMRVLDIVAPVGRGSRGLIVAPPRSGKTILMRKFANGITEGYPDVQLMVLLIDERPEEATEWKRTTRGQVFVSTNDEDTRNHVELAEAVFKRCQRLVELGQDVVLLLDSITRLARAYNNYLGTSGKTMSGGLDSRAMERPRAFFGMARNTETAGSLTILGTTLVETGSRLDQMVFEEFKGTGNLEIVLSRKLADRRIFPAIDIERSGTRKEEKLFSSQRLKRIQVLRRVLLKMNFIEAMELLVAKLEDVEKIDDFLKRFEVDPDA